MTAGLWPGIVDSAESLPPIGENIYGGYVAGVIDTTRAGTINGADAYQTGSKYLLIVSPKSLETTKVVKTADTAGPTGVRTRWNGLGSTEAMKAAGSAYEAASYCYDLSYPSDGHSRWYLPALDELELLWRNLKPQAVNNSTATTTTTFPSSLNNGFNPSSDPTGSAYTTTNPGVTSVSVFLRGNSESTYESGNALFWTSTEAFSSQHWYQVLGQGPSGFDGRQFIAAKSETWRVRPVRRVLL